MHTSVLMGWKRLPHMERLLYLHCGNSKSDNGQEGTAITVFHKADLIQTDNQTSSVFRTTVRQIVLRFCKNCSRVHQEKSGNKMTPAVRKRNEGLTGEYVAGDMAARQKNICLRRTDATTVICRQLRKTSLPAESGDDNKDV